MNSISPECQDLKVQYDQCFNKWFREKFLKGHPDDKSCSTLFESYQRCVKKAIKEKNIELWDVEQDVLGTDKEKQPPPPKNS
jgi:TRIAP1/MDM35 family protein